MYECYRLIDCFWLFITLLCLLLIFECCLICLGWIMKATCCLLRYTLELMFDIVNLSMLCLCCETPKDYTHGCTWCGFSHLIREPTNDPWSEVSESYLFIYLFYSFSFVLYFSIFLCFRYLFMECIIFSHLTSTPHPTIHNLCLHTHFSNLPKTFIHTLILHTTHIHPSCYPHQINIFLTLHTLSHYPSN